MHVDYLFLPNSINFELNINCFIYLFFFFFFLFGFHFAKGLNYLIYKPKQVEKVFKHLSLTECNIQLKMFRLLLKEMK